MEIIRFIEDLEKRIDKKIEEDLFDRWFGFIEGRFNGDIFYPKRKKAILPTIDWPDVCVNESLEDYDKMLLQQYKKCSSMLECGTGNIMCVRSNYGSSTLMSLFGAELFFMDDRLNTLPTSKPLTGGIDGIKRTIDRGVPDIYGGLGEKVFETYERFLLFAKDYPNIGKYVQIYHPDLQSPMDICEVLLGSSIFIDIIDFPELVHEFLELITQTYIRFMKEWLAVVPQKGKYKVHWSMLQKGGILLCDDSAMNFSPTMYKEFIKPYDQKLLNEFGGGAMHFCGRGDHFITHATEMDGLFAVNLTQPEYNNMEVIYTNTVDRGIKLTGFSEEEAKRALKNGRCLHSNVQCFSERGMCL